MTPTAKLRWLEIREHIATMEPGGIPLSNTRRVLQQWWQDEHISIIDPNAFGDSQYGYKGEWRDIPVEGEE